jgi:hypothetical protein
VKDSTATQAEGQGHEAVSALDAFCTQQAAAREAIGAKGRERLAKAYENLGRKLDADPQVQAEREAGGRALEAMQASLAAGESPGVARERAKKASGRSELRFDYTERADELRREAFAEHGFVVGHVTGRTSRSVHATPRESSGRTNGRVRGSRRGTRSTSSSSDDPGPDPEPPERRLCQNKRCGDDISHLHTLREFCDDACKQQAYRDRLIVEHLDELVGTFAADRLSCRCVPKRHLVIGGVCFTCGRPRGEITRDWLDDDMRARSFVSSRAPARRKPRYGDRKRKPVREYMACGAVAA